MEGRAALRAGRPCLMPTSLLMPCRPALIVAFRDYHRSRGLIAQRPHWLSAPRPALPMRADARMASATVETIAPPRVLLAQPAQGAFKASTRAISLGPGEGSPLALACVLSGPAVHARPAAAARLKMSSHRQSIVPRRWPVASGRPAQLPAQPSCAARAYWASPAPAAASAPACPRCSPEAPGVP